MGDFDGITVTQASVATAVLLGGIAVAIALRFLIMRAFRGPDSAPGAALLLARFLQVVLIATAVVYVLTTLGIEITPLLGALGIGGIAVALAVQSVLSNAIASVLLQIRRPFRRGDQIATNDLEGRVLEVNFRTVRLLTFDGNDVLLPSSMVLDAPITNYTNRPSRRTELVIGVDYETDLEAAVGVLRDVTARTEGVAPEPAPEAWVYEFGESTINIEVRFWHGATNAELWRVRSAVSVAIKRALDAEGMVIAFPQRVVHFAPTGEAGSD